MTEYIERGTAIAKLTALEVTAPNATMTDAKRLLADMPAADVAPVVHGRWVPNCVDRPAFFVCDQCNTVWYNDTKFCPDCGARMDGGAGNAAD